MIKSSDCREKTVEEILEENGYDPSEIVVLKDESYDSALIGVSNDGRAVYSFDKMVEWYTEKNNCTEEDAVEWIEFNTLRAIPYAGEHAPIVIHEFEEQ